MDEIWRVAIIVGTFCVVTTGALWLGCAHPSAGEGSGSASSGGAVRCTPRPGPEPGAAARPRAASCYRSASGRADRASNRGRCHHGQLPGSASFHWHRSVRSSPAIPFPPPVFHTPRFTTPMFGTVSSLIARHGRRCSVPALLAELSADCPNREAVSAYGLCGIHCPELWELFTGLR
jgi:hypothetical protein